MFLLLFFLSILKCPHCDQRFLERANMKNHIKNIHKKDESDQVRSENLMTAADRRKDNVEKLENEIGAIKIMGIPCHICGKKLMSHRTLKLHYKMHSDFENEYFEQCPFCSSKFADEGNLLTHIEKHRMEE